MEGININTFVGHYVIGNWTEFYKSLEILDQFIQIILRFLQNYNAVRIRFLQKQELFFFFCGKLPIF